MPDSADIETRSASDTGPVIRIAGLDHVVLRVGDLDRAIEFYKKVLGCRVERQLDQPKLVQLRAGASLIDLVPAAVSPQAAEDASGRNMDHFAVRGDCFDAAALHAHLRRHGITAGEERE